MGRSAPEEVPCSGIDINAPASPSGTGYFRQAFPADSGSISTTSPAFRRGPVDALRDAQAGITPVSAGGADDKIKKPPKTKLLTKSIKKESTSETDIDIKVKVLADITSNKVAKKGAHTLINFKNVKFYYPKISYDNKTNKIVKLDTKFRFKGTITIQTRYGKKAKATDKSLYGRGTMQKDKSAGTISLGFHESCHQKDYLEYLRINPLPVFTVKVGDTVQQFNDVKKKFNAAYDKYKKDIDKRSISDTDEVGYKLSKCKVDRKCK